MAEATQDEAAGITSTGTVVFGGFAARIEDGTLRGLRWARKPSGETVLQGAFRWVQGTAGGLDWRELETVDLPY